MLKPIAKNELAVAISKVLQTNEKGKEPVSPEPTTGKLSFRTVTGKVYINSSDIAYIRADGNYSTVVSFLTQETILVLLASPLINTGTPAGTSFTRVSQIVPSSLS